MRILLAPKFKQSLFGEKFPKQLLDDFKKARDELQCNYISFWAAPYVSETEKKETHGIVATTYPLTWVQQYSMFGYSGVDPALVECLQSNSPLLVDYQDEPAPERKKFYAAVRRAQLGRYSLSVPVHFSADLRTVTTYSFPATHNRHNLERHENLIRCREYAFHIANALVQDTEEEADRVSQLTDREIAILKGLSSGNNYKQIAEILGISRWTVIAHAKSARTKIGATSNSEAVSVAISRKII